MPDPSHAGLHVAAGVLAAALALTGSTGCGGDAASVSATVGPAGGTLEASGLTLSVPPGALDREVQIRVSRTSMAAPAGFRAATPIFRFEPEGLRFDAPVVVELSVEVSSDGLSVVWTSLEGVFAPLPSSTAAGLVRAEVDHFSLGFAGAPISPGDGGTLDGGGPRDAGPADGGNPDAAGPRDAGPGDASTDAGDPTDAGPPAHPYSHAGTCADPIPLEPIPSGAAVFGNTVGRTSDSAPTGETAPPCTWEDFGPGELSTPDVTYSVRVPAGHRLRIVPEGLPSIAFYNRATLFLVRDCASPLTTCLGASGTPFDDIGPTPLVYENTTATDEAIFLIVEVEADYSSFRLDLALERTDGICAAPWATCAGCVDTRVSADHCATCGAACGPRQACVGSTCVDSPFACPPDRELCATGCADLQIDSANCGSCGLACPAGQRCVSGACAAAAPGESCASPVSSTAICPVDWTIDVSGFSADVPILTTTGDAVTGTTGAYRDYVYQWVAPGSGSHSIGWWAYGLSFVHVFSSPSCDSTSLVAASNWVYGAHDGSGLVRFTTVAGTTYYVVASAVTADTITFLAFDCY